MCMALSGVGQDFRNECTTLTHASTASNRADLPRFPLEYQTLCAFDFLSNSVLRNHNVRHSMLSAL
jgi:hypothetical protein